MEFDSIREALKHVVENLIRRGHKYILGVRGPREAYYNRPNCFQVVAETMVYRNGEPGLTIHLPFDPSEGVTQELLRFLECPIRHYFDKYVWSGIPYFMLRFGDDADAAERVMILLLTEVYDYTTGTDFECEVSDEGPVDADDESKVKDSDDGGASEDGGWKDKSARDEERDIGADSSEATEARAPDSDGQPTDRPDPEPEPSAKRRGTRRRR